VRPLDVDGCSDSVACARKGEEERVALSIDLDAVRRAECAPDDAPMLDDQIGVALGEPPEQMGRLFDVREGERDGPAG
jgi:hypothetical protein